ncbi:hypothetical protein L2E82_44075 [Cichorium intybus]|uniref:Uncharacterized protein n=1 Tax=Cichorium intybus TaxID=13427 RepID=A0ACB8ZPL0_CICIN|nr:hypothetical protein L2E82_44075 [Cichorium intybus]
MSGKAEKRARRESPTVFFFRSSTKEDPEIALDLVKRMNEGFDSYMIDNGVATEESELAMLLQIPSYKVTKKAKIAVKIGIIAPIDWLNETGKYLSEVSLVLASLSVPPSLDL